MQEVVFKTSKKLFIKIANIEVLSYTFYHYYFDDVATGKGTEI